MAGIAAARGRRIRIRAIDKIWRQHPPNMPWQPFARSVYGFPVRRLRMPFTCQLPTSVQLPGSSSRRLLTPAERHLVGKAGREVVPDIP